MTKEIAVLKDAVKAEKIVREDENKLIVQVCLRESACMYLYISVYVYLYM